MKTDNIDLGKSFETLKAANGAEDRKEAVMAEFRGEFMRQGFSYWMAQKLAEEKYKYTHK